MGGQVTLAVTLESAAKRPQELVVDYVVHRVMADGSTRERVWKGWRLRLNAGERRALQKKHSLRPVTTRRDYPGVHRVELLVNGDVLAAADFDLVR